MRRWMGLAALAMAGAPAAFAQAGTQASESPWKVAATATLVGSGVDEQSPLAPASDGLLADFGLTVTREDVFDNGLVLTWRAEGRLQRDAASRPAFAGVLGGCSALAAGCPRVGSRATLRSPISPVTGIAVSGIPESEEMFGAVEGASVSLFGPWGEGVLGLDAGAAARLDARAPAVLQRVSAFSSSLDPSGLVVTRARNDVTGPSAKATYLSPRWIGFKAGVSYTPQADQRSVDFDPDFDAPGLVGAHLENVWEGALSFDRQFAQQGLHIRGAITATHADSGSASPAFGDYEALGAGLELEKAGWTGGVRWLSSDNAIEAGTGDYEAWEIGLVHQGEVWRFGIEGGWSTDALNRVEGSSWLVGVSRKMGDHVRLGVAWMDSEADLPVSLASTFSHQNARNDGLVVELSVGNW